MIDKIELEISKLYLEREEKIKLNKQTWYEIKDLNYKLRDLRIKRDRLATLEKFKQLNKSTPPMP